MNRAIEFICLGAFMLLPFCLLWMRAARPQWVPWWAAILLTCVLGWLLINGGVYFHYAHLQDLVNSYGGHPPKDLVTNLTHDGAKRVVALFFGWAYALYLAPFLLIYGAAKLIQRFYSARINSV